MKTLLLSRKNIREIISAKEIISAVEESYKIFSSNQVVQPDYIGIHMPSPRGEIDFKVSYNKSSETISAKASSGGFPYNLEKYGVPSGMGTILIFDARNCALVCIMDGSLVTGLRTGASGAVSVKFLARKNSKIITSIGTGNQARMQILAISEVMKIDKIYTSINRNNSAWEYKKYIESKFGIPVVITDSKKEAVEMADILITTTRGRGPFVEAGWIKPGTHIVAIGTDQEGKQEFDPKIFRHAKIVVDSISQCIKKGEVQHALNKNIIGIDDIYGEIGEVLLGEKKGRESDEEITIFDSTGMSIQDNVSANFIYKMAIKNGIGINYDFID